MQLQCNFDAIPIRVTVIPKSKGCFGRFVRCFYFSHLINAGHKAEFIIRTFTQYHSEHTLLLYKQFSLFLPSSNKIALEFVLKTQKIFLVF